MFDFISILAIALLVLIILIPLLGTVIIYIEKTIARYIHIMIALIGYTASAIAVTLIAYLSYMANSLNYLTVLFLMIFYALASMANAYYLSKWSVAITSSGVNVGSATSNVK